MMSPRSPSSRSTGSALGDTIHLPVSISLANPKRSSFRARSQCAVPAKRLAHVLVGALVAKLTALLLGEQHPDEPGEAVGVHLTLELLDHLKFGLPAQFRGNDLAGALANTIRDIVAGYPSVGVFGTILRKLS
jgi:hypothetical protein